jgi:hypothetical protein
MHLGRSFQLLTMKNTPRAKRYLQYLADLIKSSELKSIEKVRRRIKYIVVHTVHMKIRRENNKETMLYLLGKRLWIRNKPKARWRLLLQYIETWGSRGIGTGKEGVSVERRRKYNHPRRTIADKLLQGRDKGQEVRLQSPT